MITLLVVSLVGSLVGAETYIPPYLQGQPISMRVVSLDPPDYRGQDVFRVEFDLEQDSGSTVTGMIHRSAAEFTQFNHMLHSRWIFDSVAEVVLPEVQTVESLTHYLELAAGHKSILKSNELHDFLGINWSGSDLTFMSNLTEFMKVVIPALYRSPEFPPEPPVFDTELDAITAEETPFEVYLYLNAYRAKGHINEFLAFFKNYTDICPSFEGLPDDSDVQPEGVTVEIPPHFDQTYVHFLPGGYLNGRTVRTSFLGKSKFNFLHEDLLEEWLTKLYGDMKPKRILDIGTGPGFSAFVLAQMFPEAEVIAVDLAAPYIRMARQWQTLRNIPNIKFYHANAEDMSWLESDSFDLISYAYVLHEMPAENCMRVITEMYRLLKEGGKMNGFEVPFIENAIERFAYVEFNTWGYEWDVPGPKGPEPYIGEYEFDAELTKSLAAAGFKDINQIEYSYFESVFQATK